ncbi:unnamed protein product [Schistocephalus solidus]|uniref:Uncharacterized protein n=1 Tax=Schistocephalus solidus TaxID=70667 RepID=A0A183TAX6_SCHSO|nr:unnamed protein product [Schistocephalus solidus]
MTTRPAEHAVQKQTAVRVCLQIPEPIPEEETNGNLDLLPSLQEIIRAVQQLSSRKAPASDAIPAESYNNHITQKLDELHAPGDNATVRPDPVIQSTNLEVLGRARRQHQDWFDDNDADISNLHAEKNRLHKAYMDLRTDATKAAFFRCRRLVQQRLRETQDAWMVRKVEEIQAYADRIDMKTFFKVIKAIYGSCIKETAPLLSSDGTTLLIEKSQIPKALGQELQK